MSVNCNYTLGFNETQNSLKAWHLISFTLGNLKDHAGPCETRYGIEQFVCQLYQPKVTIKAVKDLILSSLQMCKGTMLDESLSVSQSRAAMHGPLQLFR